MEPFIIPARSNCLIFDVYFADNVVFLNGFLIPTIHAWLYDVALMSPPISINASFTPIFLRTSMARSTAYPFAILQALSSFLSS